MIMFSFHSSPQPVSDHPMVGGFESRVVDRLYYLSTARGLNKMSFFSPAANGPETGCAAKEPGALVGGLPMGGVWVNDRDWYQAVKQITRQSTWWDTKKLAVLLFLGTNYYLS